MPGNKNSGRKKKVLPPSPDKESDTAENSEVLVEKIKRGRPKKKMEVHHKIPLLINTLLKDLIWI